MHAKVTVADDVVFLGSFNLSHSGEMNAENVLEIADPALADRLAAQIDQWRERYAGRPGAAATADSRSTTATGSSCTEIRSRSSAAIIPSASSRPRTQSRSPAQYSESISTTAKSTALPVCMSVSASNSSSRVPKPPGRTTKPQA